jgi:hypothetical protein
MGGRNRKNGTNIREPTMTGRKKTFLSSPQEVESWLVSHDGKLDRQDGPAIIERFDDGST